MASQMPRLHVTSFWFENHAQDASKTALDAPRRPKNPRRGHKTPPRSFQDGPRHPQDGSKTLPGRLANGSKTVPRRFCLPRRPKTLPRCPQDAPRKLPRGRRIPSRARCRRQLDKYFKTTCSVDQRPKYFLRKEGSVIKVYQ